MIDLTWVFSPYNGLAMLFLFAWARSSGPGGTRSVDQGWSRLLVEISNGEQNALHSLYEKSSRLVYGVVLKIVGNQADAEEVTLDVYSQVWRKATDFNPERAMPSTWLVMLARSRALDRRRSAKTRLSRESALDVTHDPVDPEANAEESAWLNQRRQLVTRALNELPDEQRAALELAFYGGLSHGDIATRLKLPLGTVKARIRLGMAKLRQSLQLEGGAA